MAYLVDTNVLLRSHEPTPVQHLMALNAVLTLRLRGETLCVAQQNLIEFRNVATRPSEKNGLGISAQNADQLLTQVEEEFSILPDSDAISDAIYVRWRTLVAGLGVMGKQVHDIRLVAAMLTYDVTHLLTFNIADFTRFQALPTDLGASIHVISPHTISIPDA